jgi:tetratricopeptide (TPR) repeat protein
LTRDAVGAAKQLRELPEQDFRSFVERTLKGMGLVAKGVKASDKAVEFDVIHSASNDHYLVFATKDVEHAKPHDIQKAVERMRKAGVPRGIYLSTGEVSKDAEEYATQFDVAVADAERLGQLLVKFGLDDELDKRSAAAFLEKDGDRKLPSMGQLDSMMSWGYDFFERGNYAKALEYFEKASALKPSYDVPLAMSGKCLSAMGQHEKAVESYEEALRQNPGSEEGWFNLGTALYALGKHEDELACYDKALELNKGYERAWNNKGATLLQLGKDEEAAICFEKALRSNPKNVSALSNRGVALKHLGRLDEALASFDLALSVSSENLDAWLNRGLLLQDMGRNLEAVKSYDRVLTKVRTPEMCAQKASALLAAEVYKAALDSAVAALDMKPGWDVAMELKAAAELGLKKEDESRVPAKKPERLMPPAQRAPEAERERAATVERVEEVTPPAKPERQVQASQAPLFNSLRDFATGESDDAVMFTCSECGSEVGEADNFCIHCGSDLREEAEDDSPSAAEPEEMERIEEARFDAGEELEFEELVGLGEAWMRLRRYEDAIGWFGEALLLKNEARLYRMQGEAAYELGLFDDAIRHFEEALDIDPADIESSWCRADALLRCGRHAVALEAYGSIEAAEGKSARLAIAKARALTAWGRPGKAAEALAEAAAAEGDNSNLWNLAGVAMSSAGRVDDATTCLDKAAQCDPGQWEVWCNRGAVLASRGELELAIKSFDRALAAKPDAGQAIGGKASVLTRQGRADEAVELLDEALSIRQDAGLYATKAFALPEARRGCDRGFRGGSVSPSGVRRRGEEPGAAGARGRRRAGAGEEATEAFQGRRQEVGRGADS